MLAVGVRDIFHPEPSFTVTVAGYVIMRIAMVLQWLRAANEDNIHRATCLRYAIGIAVAQAGWVAWLFLPLSIQRPMMPLLMLFELLIPRYAERAEPTPWHPHHIAERYGLMTIIVLGEGILGTTNSIAALVQNDSPTLWFLEIFPLGLGAAALTFTLWWSYFKLDWGDMLERQRKNAPLFGYAHYVVFAALAAVGTGLELVADRRARCPLPCRRRASCFAVAGNWRGIGGCKRLLACRECFARIAFSSLSFPIYFAPVGDTSSLDSRGGGLFWGYIAMGIDAECDSACNVYMVVR